MLAAVAGGKTEFMIGDPYDHAIEIPVTPNGCAGRPALHGDDRPGR